MEIGAVLLGLFCGGVVGVILGFFATCWWLQAKIATAQATVVDVAKDKATSFILDQVKKRTKK